MHESADVESYLAVWNCVTILPTARRDLGNEVAQAGWVAGWAARLGVAALLEHDGPVGEAAQKGVVWAAERLAGASAAEKPYWCCAHRGCLERARWCRDGDLLCDDHR
jgi:hypothetical protein